MNTPKFVAPEYSKDSFNCPHCGAFAHQKWEDVTHRYESYKHHGFPMVQGRLFFSECAHCLKQCIWLNGKMIFPDSSGADLPNEDLSDDVKADYMEAASVLQKSPRAAAALLRLALQKLCKQLGGKGKTIQEDIDLLVEKGLPRRVVEAMDSVRIIGNEALHPGQMDIRDDAATAAMLFRLINFVAEKTLTEPKQLSAFYAGMPDSKKRKIRGGDDSGGAD